MVRWGLRGAALLLVVVVVTVSVQQYRYQDTRHSIAMDRQTLFYPSQTFHVTTLLKLSPDQNLFDGVGDFIGAAEKLGAKPIYAGQAVITARISVQIRDVQWDAIVLLQYPSRTAWHDLSENPAYVSSIAKFRDTYSLGLERPAVTNLVVPLFFQARRAIEFIKGKPERDPFQRVQMPDRIPADVQAQLDYVDQLVDTHSGYGKDALVVVNFQKMGNAKQTAANSEYGNEMMAVLAEHGGGPMHIGKAVTLEGNADFDQIAIVYYPGIEFFFSLVRSKFFNSIVGGKQLGDDLAVLTVPILPHLRH